MADKKLLEESTIRRFMQLANIDSRSGKMLTENVNTPFSGGKDPRKGSKKHLVSKNKHSVKEASSYEEEGMTGMNPMSEEDMGMDVGGEEVGMDVGGAEGGDTKTKVENAVDALSIALNDILSAVESNKRAEVDSSGDDSDLESDEPMDDFADDEASDELDEPEELEESESSEELEESEDSDESPIDESIQLADDDFIDQIVERVTSRLVRESKSKKTVSRDELVETLLNRVTSRLMREAKKKGYSGHGPGNAAPFNKPVTHQTKNSKSANARTVRKSINNRKK